MDQEQIDQRIVQSLQGQLSGADQRALSEWRRESLENERYFQNMVTIWNVMENPEIGTTVERPSAAEVIRMAARRRNQDLDGQKQAQKLKQAGVGPSTPQLDASAVRN